MIDWMKVIMAGDAAGLRKALASNPALAQVRTTSTSQFLEPIRHHVYKGDTPLHIAAASNRPDLAKLLLAKGADPNAENRMRARPLHYAVDGGPGSPTWDPKRQARLIRLLLEAGADLDASDRHGTPALHRAIRNRCAEAVRVLIELGADPRRPNGKGSKPLALARQTTGRGGSGSPEAKEQQRAILELLEPPRG